ncbi:MAG: phosphoenolpyruvate--protein phosphotransferase [Actinomycetales bacterium]|nr:phosphoenolpyruvate--protein phosphotransferase [Actinomycetales bacterium]
MTTLSGIPASSGAAVGPYFLLNTNIPVPSGQPSHQSFEAEGHALNLAIKNVGLDLAARAARTTGELQEILLATAEIATDPAIAEEAAGFIASGHTASYAMVKATEVFQELLAASGGYLAERVSDVANIRDRVLCELAGIAYPEIPHFDVPTVLIAQDLSPADTADLETDKILAIVTAGGGPTSHTAIIARSNGIAAVVACAGVVAAAQTNAGSTVAVDATNGQVTFNPDLALKAQIATTIEKIKARKSRVITRSADGYVTTDGTAIPIYANIGRIEDTVAAVAAGADGVGLLRTELLYLDRNDAPTLQEQTAIYTQLFQPFAGQKVVIRTLDAGADKPMAFINFDHEPNPALGVRGYRTIFGHEHLLRTQLQAIANAAKVTQAEVWVMAPMITLPGEAAAFVSMAREYGLTKAGVMIEVPAAIFHADEITKVCDFVSIGTNDLGQYLHAADRESAPLAGFNDPWQPALLRAVHQVAQAGVKNNTPVGVCGEAASDAALASVLIGLGVSSLSCSVATLTDVAQAITAHSVQQLILAGNVAIAANTAQDAKNSARQHLSELVNLGL